MSYMHIIINIICFLLITAITISRLSIKTVGLIYFLIIILSVLFFSKPSGCGKTAKNNTTDSRHTGFHFPVFVVSL